MKSQRISQAARALRNHRRGSHLSKDSFTCTVLVLAMVTAPMMSGAVAEVTLYDNFDQPGGPHGNDNPIGPRFDSGDRFAAQPFNSAEFEAISSVTVKLQRRGTPTGPLELEIWNDGGGHPGQLIGTLGSVDLADIDSGAADFVTFEGLVTGLAANQAYYAVLDPIDANIPNRENTYHIGTTTPDGGTNGAGRLQVSLGPTHDNWKELSIFLPSDKYLQMSVAAVPLLGDFDDDGSLDSDDIDLLSQNVLTAPTNPSFDLNNDRTLTTADREIWVQGLAGAFFGDADLDGEVAFSDFLKLSEHFGDAGGWSEGDFDGNGRVNFPDFLALSENFGQSAAATAAVPEPSSIVLLLLGVAAFKRRRPYLGYRELPPPSRPSETLIDGSV